MSTAARIEPAGPVRAFRSPVALAESARYFDDFVDCPELNFGPLQVRVPPDAVVRMSSDEQYSDAVYFDFPTGTVRLSVFAAPRNHALWPSRAEEIAGSQAGAGAQVSSVWGDWGRELHIVDDHQYNWVIGVDGARWMLLGRATWVVEQGWELVDVMRSMIRTARVDRGAEPMPVRAPMPLTSPGTDVEESSTHAEAPYSVTVTMRMPDREAEPELAPDPHGPPPPAGDLPARAPAASSVPALPGAAARPARTGRSFAFSGRVVAAAAAAVGVAAGSLWLAQEPPSASPVPPAAMPAAPPVPLAPSGSLSPGSMPPITRAPALSRPPRSAAAPARPPVGTPRLPTRTESGALTGPVGVQAAGGSRQGSAPSAGDRSERTRSRGSDKAARQRTDSKRGEDQRSEGSRADPHARPRGGKPVVPGPLDDVARLPGQLLRLAPGL